VILITELMLSKLLYWYSISHFADTETVAKSKAG